MPTQQLKLSDIPEGTTCVDLEAKYGLARGDVSRIVFDKDTVTVESKVALPITDWKAEYAAADTVTKKAAVLARYLGLT